jgi:hypothetical protein
MRNARISLVAAQRNNLLGKDEFSMSSTTGVVQNNTGMALTFSAAGVSHGSTPNINIKTLQPGTSGTVFIANSDGAGVEGNITAAGPQGSGVSFNLFYDNPVVGSNSGSVTSDNPSYKGVCNVGSGDDNTVTYNLLPNSRL